MKHILVTGSADGIGQQIAQQLTAAGHHVVLHARTEERAVAAKAAVPAAADVVVGDLASLEQTRALAATLGRFDAVVHNAGIARMDSSERALTEDGLDSTFQVNVLAPYLLTALMPRPGRLVFMSSALAAEGVTDLRDVSYETRQWNGYEAYCSSKLYCMLLAFAFARRWPDTLSNAVDPGWVRTRMGGAGAPTDPADAARVPAWLAASDEALDSGGYLTDRDWHPGEQHRDPVLLDELLALCAHLGGARLGEGPGTR
ncbi:SDR family NAD(P)-dependent oxidoreductase [Dactylosporangium sucinum]|uniref:Short-chain dehydrogenase n=1 Tax=Dactylosporangium sucinum TaxID=1424081 RepID=A0A917TWH1_9ACTN|nr:SDR family NAD(P)-dependent oxidoreductase [Dactylosporangium sucinum]GGM41128.1 short-chain dehydrogenase [Dactylosporangium sucinum]